MKKHLIVIGTVVLLLAVGLSGCNEINPLPSEEDRFVGTWENEYGDTIVFFSDGTGSQTLWSFQWEIKDNKLVREIDQDVVSIVVDYQFSDDDTTLTLAAQVYTKINENNQDTTQLSILLFNVEPSRINKGETANLIWNVTGATTVSIDNDIGDVSLSGTRIISPIQNTTYVLAASNSNTSKMATTQIIVLDNSESDDDESVSNIPPLKPIVNGPWTGNKNTAYNYTAVSTDANNDAIKYAFNWNDGQSTMSDFLPSGTATTQTHSWVAPGAYEISVRVFDNETVSATTKFIVLIDTYLVKDIGYLIDDDSDGTYDSFKNFETGEKTNVEKQDDGTYLIDNDGDGYWDYIYDVETDSLEQNH